MSDYTPEVGHRVEIVKRWTGVVTELHDNGSFLYIRDGDDLPSWALVPAPHVTVTRLPDPEPDWQPGDVAKDAEGRVLARSSTSFAPWFWADAPRDHRILLKDDEVARPLTPLVLNGKAVVS